jgi:hypothetical protein
MSNDVVYTTAAWRRVVIALEPLDIVADDELRADLESAARLYHLRVTLLPRLKGPAVSKGLRLAAGDARIARELSAKLLRSRALWLNAHGAGDGAALHIALEACMPVLAAVEGYLAGQGQELGPQADRPATHATKEAQNRYYQDLVAVWAQIDAKQELKTSSASCRFLVAAAAPVLGLNVATPGAVKIWLLRHKR